MSNIYILSNELCDFCNVPYGTRMHIKQIVRKIEDYIIKNELCYNKDCISDNRFIFFDDNLKRIFNDIDMDINNDSKALLKILEEERIEHLEVTTEMWDEYSVDIISSLETIQEKLKKYTHCFNDSDSDSDCYIDTYKNKINSDIFDYYDGYIIQKKTVKYQEYYEIKKIIDREYLYKDFKDCWKELFCKIRYEDISRIEEKDKHKIELLKGCTHNFNDIDMYLEMSGHLTPVLKQEITDTLNKISNKIDNVKSLVSFSNDAGDELIEVNKLLKELEEMYNSK